MWWIFPVGFLVVCIIFGCLEHLDESYSWKFMASVISGIMIVFSLLFSLIAAFNTFEEDVVEVGKVKIQNLYAFQDSEVSSISGGGNIFFWGFSTDEGLKYRYITDGNIGKVVVEDDISGFEIMDNENQNPRIEYHTFSHQRTDQFWIWMFGEFGGEYEVKVAYIPNGSLIQNYNVDLE